MAEGKKRTKDPRNLLLKPNVHCEAYLHRMYIRPTRAVPYIRCYKRTSLCVIRIRKGGVRILQYSAQALY